MGVTRKKSLLYRERDEGKRQAFLNQIDKILKSEVLYVDESGVDQFAYREYGWAPKGEKAYGEISGKRYARESFIAAKSDSKIIAPYPIEKVWANLKKKINILHFFIYLNF